MGNETFYGDGLTGKSVVNSFARFFFVLLHLMSSFNDTPNSILSSLVRLAGFKEILEQLFNTTHNALSISEKHRKHNSLITTKTFRN